MSKIMIVAEKPTAALKIASSLADTHPVKKALNKVPYYELTHKNKKIVVVCAVGHLYNLREKGKKGWVYPTFSLEWAPTYETNKSSAYTKNYILLIQKLSKEAKKFVIATDFDLEGEVIGLNIIRFACGQKDAHRMKFSTLTKDELIDSYANAANHLDWLQAEAGETRHKLDWLFGINLSRALTLAVKSTGHFKILSSGRVQGPALKILSDREKEIKKFKSEPYWEIFLDGLIHNEKIKAQHKTDKFWDKNKASEIITKTKGHQGIISDIKKIAFEKTPPIPFDLTTLQTEAYRTLKVQPKHTLEIAQELYISGLISYPRTSSQKLPPTINYKKIISQLTKQKEYEKLAEEILSFNQLSPIQGKSDDPAHPAIYPTGEIKTLQSREKQLYDLIVHRFLSAFAPNSKRETDTIEIDVNKEIFLLSGTKTLEQGWQKFYGKYVGHKDVELPEAKKEEPVKVKKITLEEKETQPPKRYTPASIIKELTKRNLGTKCLSADTLVRITSNKKIQDIKISKLFDDLSYRSPIRSKHIKIAVNNKKTCFSFNEFNEIESSFKLISKRKLNKNEKIYRIEYKDNNFIELTEDHPLLIYENNSVKYIRAKNLRENMKSVSSIKFHDKIGGEIYSWFKFLKKCNKKSSLYSEYDIKKIRGNYSQQKFATKCRLSQSTICEYEKRKNVPLYLFKKLSLDKPEYLNGENKRLKIKNPFPLKISSPLARLLAKFVGDASIDKKKIERENCFDFRYHNTNLDLINQFIEDIYKVFRVKLEMKQSKKRKNQSQRYYVRVPAVIGRILAIISEEIIEKNVSKILKKEFFPEFVGSLFDDEGHCGNKEKKIFISNTNFKLLKDVKKMLAYLGIESKLSEKQFKLYIRKVKSLDGFFNRVPFISVTKKRRLVNLLYKEEIISKDFMTKTIKAIKKIAYGGFVYDITNNPENPNFVLGNGVVVHNSTRASIIDALYERNYIIDTSLEVTNLGLKIEDTLEKYCPEILDEKLTREFEEDMDKIREKKIKGEVVLEHAQKFLTKTLKHFKENEKKIGKALEEASVETRDEMTLLGPCHVCKKGQLRITFNRRFKSYFISCNAYPDCKTTFSLPWGLPQKTGQVCKECGYPVVKIIRKGKRPIMFCINKSCKLKKEYFEEQEAKSKKSQKK